MTLNIKDFLVPEHITIKDAMRQMGKAGYKIIFVVDDDERLLGSVTDGDIRRWILKGRSLQSKIDKVYNRRPLSVSENYQKADVKKIMLREKIGWIPVIDKNKRVNQILLWSDVFEHGVKIVKGRFKIPVVIMAGGKGTRLDPYTRILPKPLIPIGDKTILEMIIEKFTVFGVNQFYLSINHKSRIIKAYFEEIMPHFNIKYLEESEPLGTAGSLRLLLNKIRGPILVSNCDIIIDADYPEIVEFHKSKGNDITIVGSFRHFTIPYGICQIENGGTLLDIEEKPEYDFLANTGMYVLESKVLKHIPKNKFFNMTDLIKNLHAQGGKVGVYPIDEKSWIDVGQLEEYHHTIKMLEMDR